MPASIFEEEASKRAAGVLRNRFNTMIFIKPVLDGWDQGLLKAFIFRPSQLPLPTEGSLEKLADLDKAKADLEELVKLKNTENERDDYKDEFSVCVSTSADIGTVSGSVGNDLKCEIEITKVKLCKMDDIEKLCLFVEKFAGDYVFEDREVKAALFKDQGCIFRNGRSDVVVGFQCTRFSGNVEINTKSSVAKEAGGGATSVKRSREESKKICCTNGTFGAKYVVVHLRGRWDADNKENRIQLINLGRIVGRDDEHLREIYEQAFWNKLSIREKLASSIPLFAFMQPKEGQVLHIKEYNPENAIVLQGGRLGDGDNIPFTNHSDHEQFPGSWCRRITASKETLEKVAKDVRAKGKAVLGRYEALGISFVREVKESNLLPIFFNPDNHEGIDLSEMPLSVLCYECECPGCWCLRPVATADQKANGKVLTMYDAEWKLRESIVCVREEDTSLHQKLGKFGFHILETEQEAFVIEKGLKPKEGGLLMGRQELTHRAVMGTVVPDVEFRDGFLCDKDCGTTSASNPGQPMETDEEPTEPGAVTVFTSALVVTAISVTGSTEAQDQKRQKKN